MRTFQIHYTEYKEIKLGSGKYLTQQISAKDSDSATEKFLNNKKSLGEIVVVNAIITIPEESKS
jgi:hypothetical protein